jgi:hypothetical protein
MNKKMSTRGVGTEVSSIKPEIEGKPVRELKFKYDTAAYDSYSKQGFEPPDLNYRPDKFEVRFLSAADPSKEKVKVRITRMFRLKAIDYESEKHENKEYLYYETEWRATQWNGNPLGPIEHVEGMHKEQTKKLVLGDFDPKTGIQKSEYVMDVPKTLYTIPFSKKAVDDILEKEHPFGPDSINTTDKDAVVYYGKFDHILGLESFRCGDFTYDQFVVPSVHTITGSLSQQLLLASLSHTRQL